MSARLKVKSGRLHDTKDRGCKLRAAPQGVFFVPHMLYLNGICCIIFQMGVFI